jgi:hypothetical protein
MILRETTKVLIQDTQSLQTDSNTGYSEININSVQCSIHNDKECYIFRHCITQQHKEKLFYVEMKYEQNIPSKITPRGKLWKYEHY